MVQFQKPRKFIMGLHPRFHIPAVIETLGGSLVTPNHYFPEGVYPEYGMQAQAMAAYGPQMHQPPFDPRGPQLRPDGKNGKRGKKQDQKRYGNLQTQYSQNSQPFTQSMGSQYGDMRYSLSQDSSNYGSDYGLVGAHLGTQDSFLDGFSTQGSDTTFRSQQF